VLTDHSPMPSSSRSNGGVPWLERGRVPGLDGLRAVSILLVLLEHSSLTHGFPLSGSAHLGDLGRIGVAMFFVISGFLITMLLGREWERTQTISLTGFYRRRALRILPAYVAFLGVVFIASRLRYINMSSLDWTGVLTYTVNFIKVPAWEIGHVWSLSVEEQFYLVWPFLVVVLSPPRALWVVATYLAGAPLIRLVVWAFFRQDLHLIEDLTPLHMDTIAAGCLLALLAARPAFRGRFLPTPQRATLISIAAAMLIAASTMVGAYISAFDVTFRDTCIALSMAAIVWSVATTATATRIGRLLETRPMVFVGVLSYSLYLWQQLFLNPHNTHWIAAWPANVVLAIGVALISYFMIESPFLRLKDRSTSNRTAPSTAEAAASAAIQSV
jgi:peptidoglycan/LPS O-acetylase OafA/YrhL